MRSAEATLWDWTTHSGGVPSDATSKGMWTDLTELPDAQANNPDTNWHSERNAVHGVLLRNPSGTKGKVLMFRHFHWFVYDLDQPGQASTGPDIVNIGTYPNLGQWPFCAGHSFLPDGRLLVTGGDHSYYDNAPAGYPVQNPTATEFMPPPWAAIFDPANNSYTAIANMPGNARWYPTNVTMPDGSVLVASGNYWAQDTVNPGHYDNGEADNEIPWIRWQSNLPTPVWSTEVLNPLGDFSPGVPRATLPLYPFFHVLPSGLFYAGAHHEAPLYATCAACISHLYKWGEDWPIVAGTEDVANRVFNHDHGTSVLLTLAPPYFATHGGPERILLFGGGHGGTAEPPYHPSTGYSDTTGVKGPHRGAEIFDAALSPRWHAIAPMIHPRKEVSGTMLPDGDVFVSGGHYVGNPCFASCPDPPPPTNVLNSPVLLSEMFDATPPGSWSPMANVLNAGGRKYHSFSVLLPDGRVLTAGDDVLGHKYEIFYPPYLFKSGGGGSVLLTAAERPSITGWAGTIEYGFPFFVQVTGDEAAIDEVCLIAPSAATHGNNMTQRRVKLDFEKVNVDSLDKLVCTAPWEPEIAPPGDYMLVVLDGGVPSVAQWVRLQQRANYVANQNETWGGKVHLNRDFTIESGDTLRILPGTDVFAAANRDSGSSGDYPDRVEVINRGTMLAQGTAASPILFSSHLGAIPAVPGEWGGFRMDLAGIVSPSYGFVGSVDPVSKISYATIANAKIGIQIEGLCAPGLEFMTFANIESSGGLVKHIFLDSTDVALPGGKWRGLNSLPANDRARWDLQAPLNIVATNGVRAGKDHPNSNLGTANKVDLFGDGPIITRRHPQNSTLYLVFRPETQNNDLGGDWGGIEIHDLGKGTSLEKADVGHTVDGVSFFYPESCAVKQSLVHHYANYGIWVKGGGIGGATVDSCQIDRGVGLNANLGIWGVYAENAPSLRVLNTKIYDYAHGATTWNRSTVPGGGICIANSGSFCEATLSTADSVVVRKNTIVGPGELQATERSGIQLNWACGTSNREVVIESNATVEWYFGIKMDENRDTYVKCNRIENNLRGIEFSRGWSQAGVEVRLKSNLVLSNTDNTVRVESGIEWLALGSATSTSDRGLNKIVVDNVLKPYVTQNDGVFTSGQYLQAEQNQWKDTAIEQNEQEVIAQCEPTTGPNRDQIQADSPVLTNPYTITCVPASPPLAPPGAPTEGAQAAGWHAAAPDEHEGSPETAVLPSPPALPVRSGLGAIVPNPTQGGVAVRFAVGLLETQEIRIAVYDVAGRRVAGLTQGRLEPGWRDVSWNGKDEAGLRVGAGVYFVRFEAGSVRETRKIVQLR